MRSVDTVGPHYGATVAPHSQGVSMGGAETDRDGFSFRRLGLALSVVMFGAVGWVVAHGNYYTPRSELGFNLGLGGSLLMLFALLGYPLRKRMQRMQHWGVIKHWFRLHMFSGIMGPTLILFHATFQVRSLNAAVALASMLLVVASGLIGRFIYTKIHFGLYGRRATLEQLKAQFAASSEDAKSKLYFAPQVERWLQRFDVGATETERRFPFGFFWFLTLGLRRKILEFRCAQELQRIKDNRSSPEFPGGAREALQHVTAYLKGVQRVGQFTHYERIFSLWHVLHIPLIYILVASSVLHIVAVYMY